VTKTRIVGLVLVLVVVSGFIVADLATAVRPQWPASREGDPVPARPAPGDPPFHRQPFAPSFAARRDAFLTWISRQETSDSKSGVWTDIAKLALDPEHQVNAAALQDSLDFVKEHNDTADFHMAGLVRLYHQHANSGASSGALNAEQVAALEQAFLHQKYWLDEPTPTPMELWTENHQILTYSAEYLAGQRFPDEIFVNNGQPGSWHKQVARERILRWIDWRARTGMAEWDAVIYYRMDLAALLNLVDFAQDEEVATRAAMMVDLLLFDIGADTFYGQYVSAHGRATAASIKSQAGQSIQNVVALVWGLGRFQSSTEMASISLATSERYQVPSLIEAIGQDNPEVYANLERQSIPITKEAAAQYNLSFDDIESVPIWWGMGAFTHPDIIELTVHTADEWDLWHYPDFRPLQDVAGILQKLHLLKPASALLDPDSNGVLTDEVNKITYRTPDYALASAQDYRPGEKGYQQHIWKATLDPHAVVFVTNPDSLRQDDKHRPSYWSSHGRLPRTAQYRNVLVALHDIPRHPSPSIFEARHYAFTHAYFPTWAFDQVVEVPLEGGGGWIFGRRGDGYIALYSDNPYTWQTQGPDADQELIVLDRKNVWLVQMGRAAVDGPFETFVQAVSEASLSVRGLRVEYKSPGNGLISFGWDEPLLVDGEEIPLRGYPRFDNPYTRSAEFGTGQYRFEFGGRTLALDFEKGLRRTEE
jgi:hypothetical protein